MTGALDEVMAVRVRGLPGPDEVTITGAGPVVAIRFRIGETGAPAAIGALSHAGPAAIRANSSPPHGDIRHLGPVLELSWTQPHGARPTPQLGG